MGFPPPRRWGGCVTTWRHRHLHPKVVFPIVTLVFPFTVAMAIDVSLPLYLLIIFISTSGTNSQRNFPICKHPPPCLFPSSFSIASASPISHLPQFIRRRWYSTFAPHYYALCTRVSHHGRVDALRLQWIDLGGVTATYPCHWSPYFCHPGCYSPLGRDHHPQHGTCRDRRLPGSCMRAHSGEHVSCTNIPRNGIEAISLTMTGHSGSNPVRVRPMRLMLTDVTRRSWR
ncbi:hypothetical protein EDD16DRAFT_1560471 [Pisolithus croceorrhizus]|nr:hypothetical protein EDD16DRAFT_1560471 [Pisolithus croceorrhizus]